MHFLTAQESQLTSRGISIFSICYLFIWLCQVLVAACGIFIKSRTVSVKTPEEKDLSMVEEQIIVVWGTWKEP